MKLTKRDGVYHVAVAGKGGRSRLITTGCSDRTKALKVLSESGVAELEMAAKAGHLTREAIGHITTGRRLTMDKVMEPFEDWLKTCARSPKTVVNNLITVRSWLADMKLGGVAPAAISADHIAKWINDPDNQTKRSTRGIALSCIRSLFNFMATNGWIVADVSKLVALDFSVLSHDQKEPAQRQPFTPDELERLTTYLKSEVRVIGLEMTRVENADDYSDNGRAVKLAELGGKRDELFFWLFAVTCSAQNGLRLSDVAGLEWRCFGEPGKIIVWMEKTNRRIEHILTPELEAMVTQIQVNSPTHLFPDQHAIISNVKRRALLSVQFSRICERIGIKGKSYHCTRHAAASEKYHAIDKDGLAKKLAETLSMSQIKALLGHSSAGSTKIYVH